MILIYSVISYIDSFIVVCRDEIIQHGSCLGIALAGMATGDSQLYEEFKNILYQEQAVAGEAAGLGIGNYTHIHHIHIYAYM
jgi:26S proteasome regulatory subunit N2